MAAPNPEPVTQLLVAAGRGDARASSRLWTVVYEELRQLARRQLANEGPDCTFESTTLIHEAFLRLVGDEPVEWANRRHFFAAAARAMRHIRIDDARKRGRIKRGGDRQARPVDDELAIFDNDPMEVLAVDEALKKLEKVAPRQAEVVMLRYFAGLSIDETAQALEVSPRTVDYEWRFARAWLHRELSRGDTKAG
ncbi:MAG: sigma-70 family RNA polymerase sigma factor [Planctomycetes bacterium]|nr:sigma-70 family RNA polymerase sigma factor [Planctomycetota bacterium]